MKRFFIFAGESSGDLHGAGLIHHMRTLSNDLSFEGVGGPKMREEGIDCFLRMENFQVMGFTDVLRSLPSLYRYFYQIQNHLLTTNPDAVILIDYPGFNLRLAKALRKNGFKGEIIQYIAPSVWAHGEKRIESMSSTLDLLLTIYPFEARYFAHTPLKVEYLGNPLVENLQCTYCPDWRKQSGLEDNRAEKEREKERDSSSRDRNLIAIFSGSRESEIKRNLPYQLQAAQELQQKNPQLTFAISVGQESHYPLITSILSRYSVHRAVLVPNRFNHELMSESYAAIAKSGTVTLELALHKCPTVVVYSLSTVNYLIAKYILRVNLPYYCIVNILGEGEIFPEVIGKNLTAQAILPHLHSIIENESHRKQIQERCEMLTVELNRGNAHLNAAKAILSLCI
jgi:lipid-A-disaccharide synthase